MLRFRKYTSLQSLIELTKLPHAPHILSSNRRTPTAASLYIPRVSPPRTRIATQLTYSPHLIDEMTTGFNRKLATIPTRAASFDLRDSLRSLSFTLRTSEIAAETDVDRILYHMLIVGSMIARDMTGIRTSVRTDVFSSRNKRPLVRQELVGYSNDRTVVSVENKTPAVGQLHFTQLLNFAKRGGKHGWMVPLPSAGAEGKEKGPASIIQKLAYFMTDPEHPHSYAFLSDGTLIYVLYKQCESSPSFLISSPVELTDPNLFRLLAFPFFSESGPLTPNPPVLVPPTPSSFPPSSSASSAILCAPAISSSLSSLISLHFAMDDHPIRTAMLHPLHPTLEVTRPILLSSFDASPSQATIFRGHAGLQPVVLKMAGAGHDREAEEEGRVYRKFLDGVKGVPKLFAEGYVRADNGDIAYCLVLEDVGVSVLGEGLASLEELDPQSQSQLACIKKALLDRGIYHEDIEPRNVTRTAEGGIALVDFGSVTILSKGCRSTYASGGRLCAA
ncbi:hypothetical protein C8R43DRAFT_1002167 [Mycena crocata]|nr:hypothetical protein C8R43DRAFT_1002167 [Mycena crocata]